MLLRDTELIGKKLVKYGFYRSSTDHQNYSSYSINIKGRISIQFKLSGRIWCALIVHDIDSYTIVKCDGHEAVFTPEWVIEEHKKLQALFKFARL
jgi:uncharacterized membrane protein